MGVTHLVRYGVLIGLFAGPAIAADYREPPFIRTGADVVERCRVETQRGIDKCYGMIEFIADQTEARRWHMKSCPPIVYTFPIGTVGGRSLHVLRQAKIHPEWLNLSPAEFVGRSIEAGEHCPHQ